MFIPQKSVRFGDGEFNLIEGRDIGFKRASPLLSKRLAEVLTNRDDDILVGIPDVFGSLEAYCQHVRSYWREWLPKNRGRIYAMIDMEKTYYDACFTGFAIQAADTSDEALEAYYGEIRKIWTAETLRSSKAPAAKILSLIFMTMPNP